MNKGSWMKDIVSSFIKTKPKIRPITEEECREMLRDYNEMERICVRCGINFASHRGRRCRGATGFFSVKV